MMLHTYLGAALAAALSLAAPAGRAGTMPTLPAAEVEVPRADPADSLYREAREALNGGDYRRAAELFHSVQTRFPKSAYVGDAMYYEAFALSRTGSEKDLRASLAVLQDQRKRYPDAARRTDAGALQTRVSGELARRGNSEQAGEIVGEAGRATRGCTTSTDGDDDADMRIAALNALMQMDSQRALPILKQVLARRDACSVPLRRKAVFLIAQRQGEESANILIDAARNDPDAEVRRQAVQWLGEVGTPRAMAALDSVLQSTADPELREKAIFALSQSSDARGMQALRDFAGGTGADALRAKAVFWLAQGRRGADSRAFLRTLFAKEKSEEVREAIVQAAAEGAGEDDLKWLLGIAESKDQPMEVRKKALFWAGQRRTFPVAQLVGLYDRVADQEIKEQAIWVLSERREDAAVDKLIDIARHDQNRELRKKALFWLAQSNDPRAKTLLMEIIGQ